MLGWSEDKMRMKGKKRGRLETDGGVDYKDPGGQR